MPINKLDLIQKQAGINLPLSTDIKLLNTPYSIYGRTLPNRLVIQPMEGCDGTFDGKPDTLTKRRYSRFSSGGASIIWFEATAIVNEGRANPRQLYINDNTLYDFSRIVSEIKENSLRQNGFEPLLICQLTHSGRYGKPDGKPLYQIAYNNPIFEKDNPIDKSCIVSDDYLMSLEEKFGYAASLCEKAGFDGVDIKCCHRYLLCELLSAYEREGLYGGSFENRVRLYKNAIESAKANTTKDFITTSRLNIYDGFPYPYGFGVKKDGSLTPDTDEPEKLLSMLFYDLGLKLINITMGNPYVNPHVNRPFDKGPYTPPEHPLCGVERMMKLTKEVRSNIEGLTVIASGFSYLRENAPYLAAGAIESGVCEFTGFGREAFAYPLFAKDILNKGFMQKNKCCITCGKCSELMREGTVTGCPVKDSAVYMPIYKDKVMKNA